MGDVVGTVGVRNNSSDQ